jgi:hypothetical protein
MVRHSYRKHLIKFLLYINRDSFLSATVREWNNLNLSVRNLDTLSKFKKAIRSSISMSIPRHYSYGYVRSLPFVSRFTSILMLEGSQLRLLNMISLLSVYLSQSKKKWWEFSHGAPQLQKAFDKFLLYINRNSRRMHCSISKSIYSLFFFLYFFFFRILSILMFLYIVILCIFNSMLLYTYYIFSLRMLIHIVNYCIREKTS